MNDFYFSRFYIFIYFRIVSHATGQVYIYIWIADQLSFVVIRVIFRHQANISKIRGFIYISCHIPPFNASRMRSSRLTMCLSLTAHSYARQLNKSTGQHLSAFI